MSGRVHHAKAEHGQFCDTIFPDPRQRQWKGDPSVHLQHRIICCSCGLAHDFEFQIVETATRAGKLRLVKLAPKKYAIQFRVRRNERSTAQVRRKKQEMVCK